MKAKKFPFDKRVIDSIVKEQRVDLENASIRQVNLVVLEAEKKLGVKFIRMEFGVPGLPSYRKAFEYEYKVAEQKKATSIYPPCNGTEEFRTAASKFAKMFMNIDIPPDFTVATCGAMHGCFLSLAISGRTKPQKNHIVFVDPGFSVNKLQAQFLNLDYSGIDFYERETLLERLEKRLKKGDVASVLWSSPNNPTWTVLSEEELKEMGSIFKKYDVIGIEDNAYFGMDFRVDYSKPGVPPYVPTIANYTDKSIILLSSSKIFNYAGQRVACALISPKLAQTNYPALKKYYATQRFVDAFVHGGSYTTTAGISHTAQLAVAHLMNEASEERLNFIEPLKIYAARAKFYKDVMTKNGFKLVYNRDGDKPLADGFYFTASYPGMTGPQLLKKLLHYGISVTTLNTFGSSRTEGIRICVSLEGENSFESFRKRIEAFAKDHPY